MNEPEAINLSGRVSRRRAWAVIVFVILLPVGGFVWMVRGGSLPKGFQQALDGKIEIIASVGLILLFAWASNWRARLYGGKGGIVVRTDDPEFSETKRLKRRETAVAMIFFAVLATLAILAHILHW